MPNLIETNALDQSAVSGLAHSAPLTETEHARAIEEVFANPIKAALQCRETIARHEEGYRLNRYQQIAIAYAVAVALRKSEQAWEAFRRNPFWGPRKPRENILRVTFRFVLGAKQTRGPMYDRALDYTRALLPAFESGMKASEIAAYLREHTIEKLTQANKDLEPSQHVDTQEDPAPPLKTTRPMAHPGASDTKVDDGSRGSTKGKSASTDVDDDLLGPSPAGSDRVTVPKRCAPLDQPPPKPFTRSWCLRHIWVEASDEQIDNALAACRRNRKTTLQIEGAGFDESGFERIVIITDDR